MLAILYNPTPSQIKFNTTNNALALARSTFPSGSSHERNAFDKLNIPRIGFSIAIDVMDIEKMLRFFPDIQSMKPFMAICFPGENAMVMARDFFRAQIAKDFLLSAAAWAILDSLLSLLLLLPDESDLRSISFATDWTRCISQGGTIFWSVPYPISHSRRFRLTDQRLLQKREEREGENERERERVCASVKSEEIGVSSMHCRGGN